MVIKMAISLLNYASQSLAVHPLQYLNTVKRGDIKGNLKAMWNMPYDADPLLEPEFVGLSCGQVILLTQVKQAVRGDGSATDRLLDRMIGRPEQTNKNLNVQGTYKDFMEEVARAEGIIDVDASSAVSDQPEI